VDKALNRVYLFHHLGGCRRVDSPSGKNAIMAEIDAADKAQSCHLLRPPSADHRPRQTARRAQAGAFLPQLNPARAAPALYLSAQINKLPALDRAHHTRALIEPDVVGRTSIDHLVRHDPAPTLHRLD